jgi:sterol desaturase/sphingolipid hydroxylase (fatty acid hydroxylase superfamily)
VSTQIPLLLGLLAAGYYLTTLALWCAHRFSHSCWNPLASFHMLGHHSLYPSSKGFLSDTFRFGAGRHDSIYAFAPWLALECALIWIALPLWAAVLVTVEAALVVWFLSYLHERIHLAHSRFDILPFFERARARHLLHHDCDVNFAVFDHFWDRLFSTYQPHERTL